VNRRSRLAVVIPLLCTAACAGSFFQSKVEPPSLFMLSAGMNSPPAPSAQIPVDLAVLRPKLNAGLETDRIAVLYPDRRLDFLADARWSGPLGDVLQDFAVREFRARAGLRNVSADASVFASAYWLEIEATDFQAEYATAGSAPVVRVHLLARIGNSADRRVLGLFSASAEQPAAENRLAPIIDAYHRAADAALTEIVSRCVEILNKNSETR
jgi:ABC-type uncharacterized transport system auxiliary subunit